MASALPQGLPWPDGWPAPNYTDPPTRGHPGLFIATAVITAIVVALRLYSRFYVTKSPGIDDAFLVAGFVLSIGETYVEYKALTVWGWNKHLWDVPFSEHPHVRLAAWLEQFFFVLGVGCTKISILFVYRRVATGSTTKWFIRLTWVAIALTAVYISSLTLYLFFICHPFDAYWKSYSLTYHKSFKCGNERIPILLSVCLNFVSDIYSTALPMFLVHKLQLSRKQRIGLVILFSFGILTIATGAVRIYYLDAVTIDYKPGPHTRDSTWLGWPLFAWTDAEAHLAIICASAPALKVFFNKKLRSPCAKASKTILTRSRSLTTSSKKAMLAPAGSTETAATQEVFHHGRARQIEIIHDPTTPEMAAHKHDIEKFPINQIVHDKAWKPLPPLPARTSWASSSGPMSMINRPYSSSTERYAVSESAGSRDSSGEYLPIYISGSLPPVSRRT